MKNNWRLDPKESVWKQIIFEFLWPTVDVQDIIQSCYHLDFNERLIFSKHSSVLPPVIIVVACLAEIWKAHHQFRCDNKAFIPIQVIN
jgi:hypothetical protein